MQDYSLFESVGGHEKVKSLQDLTPPSFLNPWTHISSRFRVQGSGFKVQGSSKGVRCRVSGVGKPEGFGCRVSGKHHTSSYLNIETYSTSIGQPYGGSVRKRDTSTSTILSHTQPRNVINALKFQIRFQNYAQPAFLRSCNFFRNLKPET